MTQIQLIVLVQCLDSYIDVDYEYDEASNKDEKLSTAVQLRDQFLKDIKQ